MTATTLSENQSNFMPEQVQEENKPFGFLNDRDGNLSSKRLWRSIILSIAVLLSIFAFIVDVFTSIELTAGLEILRMLFISGLVCLGLCTAEFFGNK
jgi:hypothetical protein